MIFSGILLYSCLSSASAGGACGHIVLLFMAHSPFSGSTHAKAQAQSGNANSSRGNQDEKNAPDHAKSLQEQQLNRKLPLNPPKPGKQLRFIRISQFAYLQALNIRPGSLLKPNWFF